MKNIKIVLPKLYLTWFTINKIVILSEDEFFPYYFSNYIVILTDIIE